MQTYASLRYATHLRFGISPVWHLSRYLALSSPITCRSLNTSVASAGVHSRCMHSKSCAITAWMTTRWRSCIQVGGARQVTVRVSCVVGVHDSVRQSGLKFSCGEVFDSICTELTTARYDHCLTVKSDSIYIWSLDMASLCHCWRIDMEIVGSLIIIRELLSVVLYHKFLNYVSAVNLVSF